MTKPNIFVALIDHFDGQVNTAAALGVTQAAVSYWITQKNGMSELMALRVENLTNGLFKASELCPRLAEVM